MEQTLATLVHVAPKMDIEELSKVRQEILNLKGKEFGEEVDSNMEKINPFIADNIDFKNPEKGEVIFRMRQLAKENGIHYTPSMEMQSALNNYLDRTGQSDPFEEMKYQ